MITSNSSVGSDESRCGDVRQKAGDVEQMERQMLHGGTARLSPRSGEVDRSVIRRDSGTEQRAVLRLREEAIQRATCQRRLTT